MSKDIVISSVTSKLSSLGIQFASGGAADILIDQVFLDAGWSTGNKKITYQASAYLDENDKTIYFWEFTKETGSGFSFGSGSATEFQSGKTLFRKVKSVQYGADGKAYEINLDLGAIPKAFKEAAEQYGWRFKQVLKREKASFPLAGAPLPQQPGLGNDTRTPQQNFESQRDGGQKGRERGSKSFMIGFVFLILAAILLLFLGECSLIGWVISAVLLFVYLLLGKFITTKGCFLQILIFAIIALLLFITFIYTSEIDSSTAAGQADPSSPGEQAQGTLPSGEQKSPSAFRIDYLSYGMRPGFTYTSDSGNDMVLGAVGDIGFSLYGNQAAFSNPADKVSKISVSVNAIKPPAFGNVRLYRLRPDLASAPTKPSEMKKYNLPQTFDLAITSNYSDGEKPENYLISYDNSLFYGQVRIYYCIDNLMPVDATLPSWMDSIPAAAGKGITSDALRSTIGINISVTMESGEKHKIYIEREIIAGDFFSKTRLNNINEDYQGKETPIVSSKEN